MACPDKKIAVYIADEVQGTEVIQSGTIALNDAEAKTLHNRVKARRKQPVSVEVRR